MNNIVLFGFMGCGKTTTGKIISKICGREFVDTDEYIEKNENMSINEIFKKYGEPYFRDLEHKACSLLSQKSDLIIAVGGGTMTFERNVSVFKNSNDTAVFLNVPPKELIKRLINDTSRPLLQTDDKKETLIKLYNERYDKYQKAADIRIDAPDSAQETAKLILKTVKQQEPKN